MYLFLALEIIFSSSFAVSDALQRNPSGGEIVARHCTSTIETRLLSLILTRFQPGD
jgi:hypothetical protein